MALKSTSDRLLITIGGTTGSGKTALALGLAKKHSNLVILSADSRQIYKRLDIGSAKVGKPGLDSSLTNNPEPVCVAVDVPQYLIDIAEPNQDFTLTEYQHQCYRLLEACWLTGKIPLLVGGTGLYIDAIINGFAPTGIPDTQKRSELESLSLNHLQNRAELLGISLNQSDWKNPRRLIRAIERHGHTPINEPITNNVTSFVVEKPWQEQLALAPPMVDERLQLGVVEETRKLLATGVNKTWLKNTGLTYREVIRFLDGEFTESQLRDQLIKVFRGLMKRQRTWFKRGKALHTNSQEIETAITRLLTHQS